VAWDDLPATVFLPVRRGSRRDGKRRVPAQVVAAIFAGPYAVVVDGEQCPHHAAIAAGAAWYASELSACLGFDYVDT
jgi:hypothetical protein